MSKLLRNGFVVAILVLGIVTGCVIAAEGKAPAVGVVAKDFELVALSGEKVKLSKVAEKGPVVLVVLRGLLVTQMARTKSVN